MSSLIGSKLIRIVLSWQQILYLIFERLLVRLYCSQYYGMKHLTNTKNRLQLADRRVSMILPLTSTRLNLQFSPALIGLVTFIAHLTRSQTPIISSETIQNNFYLIHPVIGDHISSKYSSSSSVFNVPSISPTSFPSFVVLFHSMTLLSHIMTYIIYNTHRSTPLRRAFLFELSRYHFLWVSVLLLNLSNWLPSQGIKHMICTLHFWSGIIKLSIAQH